MFVWQIVKLTNHWLSINNGNRGMMGHSRMKYLSCTVCLSNIIAFIINTSQLDTKLVILPFNFINRSKYNAALTQSQKVMLLSMY